MSALPNVLAVRRGARTVTALLIAFGLVAASAASARAATPETYAVSNVAQLGARPFVDVAVDESTHDVFAPNYDGDTVSIVNGTTVTSVAVGSNPLAVALNQTTDTAYVLNQGAPGSPTVSVIRGGVVTDTVPVGTNPADLAVDQSDGTIYVANYGANSVTIIDATTLATTTLPVAGNPYSIAVDSTTHTAYVATQSNTTAVISSGAIVRTVPGGYAVAFNEFNGMAYTVDTLAATVYAIDGASVTAVAVGQTPHKIAINQTTGTVYVANFNGNSVTAIDGTTVSGTIGLGSAPYEIAANSGSNAVFVSLRTQSRLAVIEGTTVVASPLVGMQPAAVTVDSSTGAAYVVNEGTGTLSTVIKTTVEQRPFIVSYAPFKGKADLAYSFDVLATGNPAPTSFAVTTGTLPDGLSLDAATGAITGIPTASGSFPFTLTVANGTSPNATASYTMV
jgi:40-residue YVTN family beta-propeller repeat